MNHAGAYSPLNVSLIFQENFKLTFFPKAKQVHATHEAFFLGNFSQLIIQMYRLPSEFEVA